MNVSSAELWNVVSLLLLEPVLAVDTETTGLSFVRDRLFAISIATSDREFFFDFINLCGVGVERGLPIDAIQELRFLFKKEDILWVGHNLKFDLHFLAKEGLIPKGPVWDTLTMARLERNDHMKYSLEACGERIGHKKDDAVKAYADSHKLYDWEVIPGKKTRQKNYHFDQIPLEVMVPYALQDARVAYELYKNQKQVFDAWEKEAIKPIYPVVQLEQKITPICGKMESHGIRVDRDYCENAIAHEENRVLEAARDWTEETGTQFTDSAKFLTPFFQRAGVVLGTTEKGNPSVDEEALEAIDHPLARIILRHRNARKRLSTYFSSFLHFSRLDGRIHATLKSWGAAHGRFSSSNPNLQNLSCDEDGDAEEYPIRRAFLADPGYLILSIDYQAMEARLMFDYAGENELIEQIKNGHDIHQATADLMGVPRYQAKTIGFGLLYGQGVDLLAKNLKVPRLEAQRLKKKYFEAFPKVSELIFNITQRCKTRGHLYNHYGRRYFFKDRNFAYKGTNYVVSGSCSDILRRAMIAIDSLLKNKRSYLQLCIHDEVIIQLDETELALIPDLAECLVKAYEPKSLPMAVGIHLGKNLHDLEKWDGSGNQV